MPTNRRYRLAAVLAAVVAAAGLLGMTRSPARAAGPPKITALTVVGNHLVDQDGTTVRLLGVNRSGTEYACAQGWGIFDGPSDAASVTAMTTWGIDAVRVPLNEDCWLGINGVKPTYSGAAYQSAVEAYVSELNAAGLVAVLDLHWSAPGTTLATGQQVMADADHSPAFWASVAAAFRTDRAVVFDLYNEPHDISWDCWLNGCTTPAGWPAAGMQSLLNAVRGAGALQPVLAGGLGWAGDLSGWLAHEPLDPAGQLAASFHLYNFSGCNTQSCWDTQVGATAAQVPVVTGELGENDCASGFVGPYMSWADNAGVSYLAWTWDTWDCSSGPALITSYDGTPTAFGAGVRDHLLSLAASSGTSSGGGTGTTTTSTTSTSTTSTTSSSTTSTSTTSTTAGSRPPVPVTRLAGADRDATAVAVSRADHPQAASVPAAVLASGAGFPDALAGVPLAAHAGGPLLLTTGADLDPAVGSELSRVVRPGGTVYILGGTSALGPQIDAAVSALGLVPVRLAGADRYATAVAVAGALGDPARALVATGADFADALAAGAGAARAGGALLLSAGASPAPATSAWLAAHPGVPVTAVGGAAASAYPSAERIVGADRCDTAVRLAAAFFPGAAGAGVASDRAFPDGLSGGLDAELAGWPLLLSDPDGLCSPTASYLAGHPPTAGVHLYGGTSSLTDGVARALAAT